MYESAACVKRDFLRSSFSGKARTGTLRLSRGEDRATRGRDSSAHLEAGHAGEFG
jgi:hypothetical protein